MEHEAEGTGISVMVSKVATVQGEGAQAAKRYGFFLRAVDTHRCRSGNMGLDVATSDCVVAKEHFRRGLREKLYRYRFRSHS